jgi:DNA polymerase-3 subunit epsilon
MNDFCSATNIRDSSFVAIDFETANHSRVSICAAGLAVFENGDLTEAPYWLVQPPKGHGWFRDDFIECHGLTHLDVLKAPEFSVIAPEMLARLPDLHSTKETGKSFGRR